MSKGLFWFFQVIFAVIIGILGFGWLLDGFKLNVPFTIAYVALESVLTTVYAINNRDDEQDSLHIVLAILLIDVIVSVIAGMVYLAVAGTGSPDLAGVFLGALQIMFWINVYALPVTGLLVYRAAIEV